MIINIRMPIAVQMLSLIKHRTEAFTWAWQSTPFDSRDSVFRRSLRYSSGQGRRAALDFQALVAGEFVLLEKFDAYAILADADMLALCGVNLALSKTDLHLALEEEAVLLDRDFADAFDFEEE